MKQRTELINNKKVDYFDKWSEPKKKEKISFNMSIKEVKKSPRRRFLNIVETEDVKQRRLELNASKAEIANGRLVPKGYKVKVENDIYVKPGDKSRQAQLIQAKESLKEAMGANRMSFVKTAS